MMPPTSIDGTDITGATIDGTDVQEITVDGQTVFTAVSLPASAEHQWKFDSSEGSTIIDSIGNFNLSGVDGFSSSNYGTDSDLVSSTKLLAGNARKASSLPSNGFLEGSNVLNDYLGNAGGDFSIAFTLEPPFLPQTGDSDTLPMIMKNQNSKSDATTVAARGLDILFIRVSDNGNIVIDKPVSFPRSRTRICITVSANPSSNSDAKIFKNAVEDNNIDNTFGTFDNPGTEFSICGDRGQARSASGLDNFILYSSELTASEVQNDFALQPWSP